MKPDMKRKCVKKIKIKRPPYQQIKETNVKKRTNEDKDEARGNSIQKRQAMKLRNASSTDKQHGW